METKTIAWGTGSGNITLTYTGQGNGSVSVKSDANDLYEERVKSITIKTSEGSPTVTKTVTIKQKAKSLDWTTKDFEYTGTVQSVELPAGRYKLQCWGAQGGSVTGSVAATGSAGGYSEGILTLAKDTTLYVFVGGKGADYHASLSTTPSYTSMNGGWNCGGKGVMTARNNDGDVDTRSYPRPGGGATDICLVTSDMSYSSNRNNRSQASLLSRFIVAGGGAGASGYYREVSNTKNEKLGTESHTTSYNSNTKKLTSNLGGKNLKAFYSIEEGHTYTLKNITNEEYITDIKFTATANGIPSYSNDYITIESGTTMLMVDITWSTETNQVFDFSADLYDITKEAPTVTTNASSSNSQGGGESGIGKNPGTQKSAGTNGSFGLGANCSSYSFGYVAGGGGAGWYGGGSTTGSYTDSSTISSNGGGSGFVNTSANASSRPSGYTGLQLDSGTTIAGNTSHPSTSGGTETGHSGNGYARITVVGNGLPTGYTRVTYVEFTGQQYVDTGFIPSNTTKLWMDFEIPTPVVGNVYYGSRNRSYVNSYLLAYSSNSNKLRTQFGSQTLDYDVSVEGRHEITHDRNVVTLDGVTNIHNEVVFTSPAPLFLGAENRNGTAYNKASFRIYGCKIYDDGVLVRDFVPVVSNDDMYGLYDLVNLNFYPTAPKEDFDYIDFEDPEVLRVLLANDIGDGIGVRIVDARNVKSLGILFKENLVIKTFDELVYFTGLTTINSEIFASSSIQRFTLPQGCHSITAAICYNCSQLTEVNGMESLEVISGSQVFIRTSLSELYLPKVTSIGSLAFRDTILKKVELGGEVTVIGEDSFYNCLKLEVFIIRAITPPTLGNQALYNTNNCPIYVPGASVEAYKTASGWTVYADRIRPLSEYQE